MNVCLHIKSKKTLAGIAVICIFLIAAGLFSRKINGKSDSEWKLVWEDNFCGNTFDSSRWSKIPRIGTEWAKYMSGCDSCYRVADGQLILRGLRNSFLPADTAQYLTGGLYTRNKMNFGNGRIEIRAKLNKAAGAWPAFWLLPSDYDLIADGPAPWPEGGEIDVMERLNGDSYAYQTVHSRYTHVHGIKNPPQNATGAIDPDGYNTYSAAMYDDSLSFHINGIHTFTYPRTGTDAEGQFPFNRDYYLLLDMQLGGSWVGKINPDDLPVEMQIDWVRFYKQEKN